MHKPGKVGPWTVTSVRAVYDNRWISISHHEVIHPDGSPGIYGTVGYANLAIGVLPLYEDGTVPLVGQHRFPLDTYSWELPEGGGPKDRDPLASAKRELAEETGLRAGAWLEVLRMDLSNSVSDEQAVGFLAWELEPGASAPEPSEDLAHQRVPFRDVLAMCLDGRITDALTIALVLAAEARARRDALPTEVIRRIAAG